MKLISRRTLIKGGAGAATAGLFGIHVPKAFAAAAGAIGHPALDRKAIVLRHNVVRTASRPGSPLQVGNGRFAFGADVTGLQSFIAFNTMSDWGWYTAPLPPGLSLNDLQDQVFAARGRDVPYDTGDPQHPSLSAWAFANPSRINLGRIGLTLLAADGAMAGEADLTDVRQELDLWTGTLNSRFRFDGADVAVQTACHPEFDAIAVRITSPLVGNGRLWSFVDLPSPDDRQFAGSVGSWNDAGRFQTVVEHRGDRRIDLLRRLGDQAKPYHISVRWPASVALHGPQDTGESRPPAVTILQARYGAEGHWLDVTAKLAALCAGGQVAVAVNNDTFGFDPAPKERKHLEVSCTIGNTKRTVRADENTIWSPGDMPGPNRCRLTGSEQTIEFVVAFSPDALPDSLPDAAAAFAAAAQHWPQFWQSGGAIDLSASKDARWSELERRIVLSQYLLAVNEAGDWPPQESGLVNTGWFGKFHMEMYWWHAAHYALWNRWPLLDRSADVYKKFLPSARARAARQGYQGARWTKMTGPDGRNSPHLTNSLLAWQQPHPMFFAELDYRARPERATLQRWQEVIFAAADFMASYAALDAATDRYDLGPPIAIVSENTNNRITTNPAFELSYWRFGLRVAQTWRQRMGLARDPAWDKVLFQLAPLPIEDGVYVTYQGIPNMWTHYNFEHPALTGVYGWLPGDGVDVNVMRATFDRVLASWRFDAVWGWDWPMLAMCAARLGRPDKAVDLLLTPTDRFAFDDAGLATGGPFPYFPSNGGLLYAVAMMAAGWDGAPAGREAPGFPNPSTDGGQWVVRHEGLSPAI